MPALPRQSVLEAVQFNGYLCCGTVEVENMLSQRVLPAKFEPRKTTGPQGAPQFLFLVRLFLTEAASIAGGIHAHSVNDIFRSDKIKSTASPRPSPPLRGGEGENSRVATIQEFGTQNVIL